MSTFYGWFRAASLLAATPVIFAQTQANPFFNDAVVQQINLTVAANDWASLLANYESDTYYSASFTWNGIVEEVGIRQHGDASRSPIKPNLDVNFSYYSGKQTFLGLSFINLKANNEDASNLHEWLSMKLFRMMGFPAPREAPAQLSINGQVFGFYMIVEHEDSTFLQRNLGESSGYLYEWSAENNYDFQNLGTDPSLYAPFLKLKSNQPLPDLPTFTSLVQAINQPLGPGFAEADFIAALSQFIDPKSFLTYAATENVLGEQDALVGGIVGMNNFYLYQFQGTTFYQLIPWDKDMTFSSPTRDTFTGFNIPPGINSLAQILITFPDYQNFYLEQLSKAASLLGGPGGWADTQIATEYGIINTAASNDPNKQCFANGSLYSCGTADFENGVQADHGFLAARADFVNAEVQGLGFQIPATDPQISGLAVTAPNDPAITMMSITPPQAQTAPGAPVNLTGVNLGVALQSASSPLPRSLGGAYVAVDGVRAPLFTTAAGQIEFQMPDDFPAGSANIVVNVGGAFSNTFVTGVQAALPVVLALSHQSNGTAVAAADPAVANEILLVYMAGLGSSNTALTFGAPARSSPVAYTAITPKVSLGSTPLTVIDSELLPGFIGLYQLVVVTPATLPAGGSANLNITAGQASAFTSTPIPLVSH